MTENHTGWKQRLHTIAVRSTALVTGLAALACTAVAAQADQTDNCIVGTSTIATCFPDTNFASRLAEQWGKQTADTFTQTLIDNTRDLHISKKSITSIAGIQHLTNLESLILDNNQIADASPLRNLVNLTYLSLNSNQISDITALRNLAKLKFFYINGNHISDITPLQNLTDLVLVAANSNEISDITALRNLNLLALGLRRNKVSDITPLQNLTNLTQLYMDGNQISDVTPLQNLTDLAQLNISDNRISDVSPLHRLTRVSEINARDQKVTLPATSNSPVTVETAKRVDGSPIAPTGMTPTSGTYDPAAGRATWERANLGSSTTVSLTFQENKPGSIMFTGSIEQPVNPVPTPTPTPAPMPAPGPTPMPTPDSTPDPKPDTKHVKTSAPSTGTSTLAKTGSSITAAVILMTMTLLTGLGAAIIRKRATS